MVLTSYVLQSSYLFSFTNRSCIFYWLKSCINYCFFSCRESVLTKKCVYTPVPTPSASILCMPTLLPLSMQLPVKCAATSSNTTVGGLYAKTLAAQTGPKEYHFSSSRASLFVICARKECLFASIQSYSSTLKCVSMSIFLTSKKPAKITKTREFVMTISEKCTGY